MLHSHLTKTLSLAVLACLTVASDTTFAQGFPPYIQPDQAAPPSKVFEAAETVARVGNQHIFQGDLEGDAYIVLIPTLERIPPEEREAAEPQVKAQLANLSQQVLRETVQRKLMYEMFLRTIPPDKLAEAKASIKERVGEQFTEALEEMVEKVKKADKTEYKDLTRQSSQLFRLAYVMKEMELSTFRELDLLLRRYGTSLERQQTAYAEDQLGRQEMYKEARSVAEVTYDDMVEYYQDNLDDFRVATRARWEQITIAFSEFPTKFAAGEAIAKVGNELFYGAPFKQVAKRHSHGDKASEGGYHDWTDWGDFKISREINEAVFSIKPGELSYIIEDAEGLHIIRVIERQDAHVIPFADAQLTIKERIQGDRRSEAINKYLAQLQDRIPVWTADDGPESQEQIAKPPSMNRVR
ncbi:MAG: peptidylprolyl isomerase [Planctomycetaceae bacterium]|nr:peptidylprolyl isomerase [Planctomycetales bacterium]MCB9937318.1 peptidylprolyl isomerase [Planctomycetaceae bacterium]